MTSLILRTLSSDRVAWQQTQWRHNSKSYHVTTSSSPLYRFIARDFIMIIVRNSWLRIPVAVYYTRDRGFKRYCGVGNRKSFGYGSSSFVVFCRYLKKNQESCRRFPMQFYSIFSFSRFSVSCPKSEKCRFLSRIPMQFQSVSPFAVSDIRSLLLRKSPILPSRFFCHFRCNFSSVSDFCSEFVHLGLFYTYVYHPSWPRIHGYYNIGLPQCSIRNTKPTCEGLIQKVPKFERNGLLLYF